MRTEVLTAALCGAVFCALIPASAAAQDAPASEQPGQGDTVFVGLGVAAVPRFEGGDSYRPVPLPVLRANRQYRYISVEGPVTRVNIVNSPDFEFGPLLNIVLNRSGNLGSDAVEQLESVKAAAEAGAFVARSWQVSKTGRVRLSVEASHDFTGVHDGWQAKALVGFATRLSPRFDLGAAATVGFADTGYAETYFAVTPEGAAASGLAQYELGSGIKDVGLGVTARYSLSRRMSLVAIGSYRRLLGEFADSPIVAVEGSPNQLFAGLALGYAF